jgi:hypothetical protein
MTRHTLFLRWWLIITLVGIGAVFAGRFGVFHEIYDKDITRLSFVIFTGFLFMSAWCGIKTYRLSLLADKGFPGAGLLTEDDRAELERMSNLEEVGWFAAGTFTSVGMVGTVIGMIWALTGFIDVNISEVTSVQRLISNMVFGVSTALYTTLVGLICSILLKLQYFNLGHALRRLPPP